MKCVLRERYSVIGNNGDIGTVVIGTDGLPWRLPLTPGSTWTDDFGPRSLSVLSTAEMRIFLPFFPSLPPVKWCGPSPITDRLTGGQTDGHVHTVQSIWIEHSSFGQHREGEWFTKQSLPYHPLPSTVHPLPPSTLVEVELQKNGWISETKVEEESKGKLNKAVKTEPAAWNELWSFEPTTISWLLYQLSYQSSASWFTQTLTNKIILHSRCTLCSYHQATERWTDRQISSLHKLSQARQEVHILC